MNGASNASPQAGTSRLRRWGTRAVVALAVLVSPFIVMQASFLIDTAPMVAVADRARPDPGWREEAHNVTGGLFCIDLAVACDSMWREYRTEQPVTVADVQRISDEAGLGVRVEGDCETSPLRPGRTGMYTACSAEGVVDGYDVRIRVLKFGEADARRIIQVAVSSIENR
ncbi:hypothetical protein [Kocuria sp. SM24M-10]|uniref:hypothetical protein n=1 Tax=Kocuria sp. SM24M-10 TaxID=1660349 RepID=UPI00064A247C|nr:hypothetical protein [Kocuria sp. SM24M-10]KLU11087.1 hypothetical protein ABL57_03080 [Kocuria sp. SM24M-10]